MSFDKLITPSSLKSDLDRAESSGDIRMLILYSNLYNEYYITILHKYFFGSPKYESCIKCNKLVVPKFIKQVEDLCGINVVSKEDGHDCVINLIFDLRNELAHNLTCTIEEIEKRFEDNEKIVCEDPTNLIKTALNTASMWKKVKLAVFASVTSLYNEHEKINNRIPQETIHYQLDRQTGNIEVVITQLKN